MAVVRYEANGETALLHFDDGKANVVSPTALTELNAALDRAESEAKSVVLTGRPGRFCAGFDLATLRSEGSAGNALVKGGAELLVRLYGFPLPVSIACTGHALGMGALLLLAADCRFGAAGDYKIGLNEVAIGMVMPHFGVELAQERISRRHLTRALVLAEIYSPSGAVDAGFLDRMTAPGEVAEEALNNAKGLSALSGPAHVGTKRALRRTTLERIKASLSAFD